MRFTYPRPATKPGGNGLQAWALGRKVHVRRTLTVTRGILMTVAVVIVVVTPAKLASPAPSATQGVTATTIRVGVPYIDVGAGALRTLGVDIDYGSFPDAFNAIIHNVNAHGGIDGRKIVPYIVAVNPVGTAPAATTCTQLTEDDSVFAVLSPLQPTCYLEHNVPVVGSIYPAGHSKTTAQDFSPTAPVAAFDPLELAAMAKLGVFKHKKVAIFGGGAGDESELAVVKSALTKLHVPVVGTAVDTAPQSDEAAIDAQIGPIAQRFKSEGASEVVAVGTGGAVWPGGLSNIQSTYDPPWVATVEPDFNGAVGSGDATKYLSNVVTATALPPPAEIWNNAGTQRCVHIIEKAYPSDGIRAFNASLPESEQTWTSVEIACGAMALFEDIAKAAGKNLTVSSFVHAGYGLRNVVLPGGNVPISFAPNRPFGLGSVYLAHYDTKTKSVVYANSPTAG
jgi:Periplasmic binding protein